MILLVDNYDSFTYNLYQLLGELNAQVRVVRNDAIGVDEALALHPSAVVLSPGPGRPAGAGITPTLLEKAPADLPMLGVCLGHQALVESEGGTLEVDPVPVHGKASAIRHDGTGMFAKIEDPFIAGRYHSLRSAKELPPTLELSAWTEDGHVMAVSHKEKPRFGLQFHPESILTPGGRMLLENFLIYSNRTVVSAPAPPAPPR